jgi:hypothetical protein
MTPKHTSNLSALSRRDVSLGALAFGAAAFLVPRPGVAESDAT